LYSQRKIVLMLAALLALAAIVAGCGGGDSSGSSSGTESATTAEGESSGGDESGSDSESDAEDESGSDDSGGPAPAKAAFIKEADKICGDADAAMTKEITKYAEEKNIPISEEEPSEDQQIEIFHAVVLPNIGRQAEEIAALTPPEGDEGTIEELTDTLSSEVEDAEQADGAPSESTLEGATKMAQAYGFKTCGG
jgi:hypothetical protein